MDWFLLSEMATNLRLEDRLDGAGNFVSWKARIVLILQENELWEYAWFVVIESKAHNCWFGII